MLYSISLKDKESRDTLFTDRVLYCIFLFIDLCSVWTKNLLRPVDKDSTLISNVYCASKQLISVLADIKTPNADSLINGLAIDVNNLCLSIGGHELILNSHSKPTRGKTAAEVLAAIKNGLVSLKESILNNLQENTGDQIGEDTLYYKWSILDFGDQSSLDERIVLLYDLHRLYGTTKVHEMNNWMGYNIEMTYPPRIEVTWAVFKEEFIKVWPKLTKYWIVEKNKSKQPSHLQCYKAFLNNESITFPNVSTLLRICIALAPNTSYLERSYSKLQMICEKRRNTMTAETIESLYLLAVLNIPVKDPFSYVKEIELLEMKI